VSHFPKGFPKKEFVYLLLVLALVAGALFMIFTFLATVEVSEAMGVVLFLVVAALLIGGYVVGLIVLVLLAFTVPTMRIARRSEQQPIRNPA
jgi:VIT1/CCC1 family predicted Fe2+/Mn2+ transporter